MSEKSKPRKSAVKNLDKRKHNLSSVADTIRRDSLSESVNTLSKDFDIDHPGLKYGNIAKANDNIVCNGLDDNIDICHDVNLGNIDVCTISTDNDLSNHVRNTDVCKVEKNHRSLDSMIKMKQ